MPAKRTLATRYPSIRLLDTIGATSPDFQNIWRGKAPVVSVEGTANFYKLTFANNTHVMLRRVSSILKEHARPELERWKVREVVLEAEVVGGEAHRLLRLDPTASQADFAPLFRRLLAEGGRSNKRTTDAQDYGNKVHRWIEHWLVQKKLGGPAPKILDQQIKPACLAFLDYASQHTIEPLAIEQSVYSLNMGYAGTPDLVARIDGKIRVPDWKTSSSYHLEQVMQNASYAMALREMGTYGNEVIHCGPIVQLPKEDGEPNFNVLEIDSTLEMYAASGFLALLQLSTLGQLWRRKYSVKKKPKVKRGRGISTQAGGEDGDGSRINDEATDE